jgi:putative membrane protein
MKTASRITIAALGISVMFAMKSPASAQGNPPSPEDFAMASAQSDAYEIAAGRVAEAEAQDSRVREFAKQMIQDHTKTSEALKAAVSKSGLPPPPNTPNTDQARMLYGLQSLKGQDFDREYIVQQVVAHQGALTVEEQYANSGGDANLKKAAASTLPMIRHHLEVIKQLHSSMLQ